MAAADSEGTRHVGISAGALYLPPLRVDLERWCEWTGASWPKVSATVGSGFRLRGPKENVYTLAASAVLRLIRQEGLDPRRVGYLALGTESASDNSAGAVIVHGMVDRALREEGLPPLARDCEVPEVKHACLGGVYALKGALRYVVCDGAERVAVVVAADHAEYERGSSGESTQGAGALALLVERDPKLLRVDLSRVGRSTAYRGADFRKPLLRHVLQPPAVETPRFLDYPVFNGHYSTVCYMDAALHAVHDLLDREGATARDLYHEVAAAFFHRPFARMPRNAFAALYVWGLARDPEHRMELQALSEAAGADYEAVLRDAQSSPDLFAWSQAGEEARPVYGAAMRVVRHFRTTPKFEEVVQRRMRLGEATMRELGNLYTAALPVWILAGLDQAWREGVELADKTLLALGYGSGDAAEALLLEVVPGWEDAARRLELQAALDGAVDLDQAGYEALHDGRVSSPEQPTRPGAFVIEHIGDGRRAGLADLGVEYYEFTR